MRALAHPRDDERGADGHQAHGRRVDARELEEEMQRGPVVGAVAVALRLEAAPLA